MIKRDQNKNYEIPIKINPPKRRFGLSHLDNINYCLDSTKKLVDKSNLVIGYTYEKSQGIITNNYMILSLNKANELKTKNINFNYVTLDSLIKKKGDIEKGKYLTRQGLIIDYNPAYSH